MANIARIKRFIKFLLGRDLFPSLDLTCSKIRLGSAYGGWDIVPLNNVDNRELVIYSFGVGEDATFDIALIEKYGLSVHAFDPTPKSLTWAKKQDFPATFIMHEYGLADFDGDAVFNPPENPDHVSHTILEKNCNKDCSITVSMKRLPTIMKELKHNEIEVLKMDIEGAEYAVIKDIVNSTIRPKQLLVEFHHRFPNVGACKTKEAIKDLRDIGYAIFSISSTGEEISFIYKTDHLSC
jgi:FkbM family methyltransferase